PPPPTPTSPPFPYTTLFRSPPVSPAPGTRVLLTCDTTSATTVTINGITFLPPKPTAVVFPDKDTTYTCTATGADGTTVTKTVTVDRKSTRLNSSHDQISYAV